MLKFSLIIPIYNVEKFLPQCLDSVLAQDIPLNEYEIICVIDGSPDNCISVVKEYQKKYSNIVLVEQENSGVSVARNKGIELSKGEYLWFIDPDDFIVSNCLLYLYKKITDERLDTLRFSYIKCEEDEKYNKEIYNICGEFIDPIVNNKTFVTIIISREAYLKHGIKFNPDLMFAEDAVLSFVINELNIKQKTENELVIYIYRKRHNSAMNDKNIKFLRNKVESLIVSAKIINSYRNKYLNSNNKELYELDYLVSGLCISALMTTLINDRKRYKILLNRMKEEKLYPFKTKKRYLNYKSCKTFKNYVSMYLEYFLCKEWFTQMLFRIL